MNDLKAFAPKLNQLTLKHIAREANQAAYSLASMTLEINIFYTILWTIFSLYPLLCQSRLFSPGEKNGQETNPTVSVVINNVYNDIYTSLEDKEKKNVPVVINNVYNGGYTSLEDKEKRNKRK